MPTVIYVPGRTTSCKFVKEGGTILFAFNDIQKLAKTNIISTSGVVV